jgi:protein-L-isoaspartate(D-aspartate) O-methyltransferase
MVKGYSQRRSSVWAQGLPTQRQNENNKSDLGKDFAIARKRMMTEQIIKRGISDQNVIEVMSQMPRHFFVDEGLRNQAYSDAPLSIGEGQTISQPYIVALMTQALALTGCEKVLEIGTGCGYQTAVLSKLVRQVYTIECVASLAMPARSRFKKMGLKNIIMRVGDGSLGWSENAPFDRILLTCAAPELVESLLMQLNPHEGIMVTPVAGDGDEQRLIRIVRQGLEDKKQDLGACRFVKLVGKYGYVSKT